MGSVSLLMNCFIISQIYRQEVSQPWTVPEEWNLFSIREPTRGSIRSDRGPTFGFFWGGVPVLLTINVVWVLFCININKLWCVVFRDKYIICINYIVYIYSIHIYSTFCFEEFFDGVILKEKIRSVRKNGSMIFFRMKTTLLKPSPSRRHQTAVRRPTQHRCRQRCWRTSPRGNLSSIWRSFPPPIEMPHLYWCSKKINQTAPYFAKRN